MTKHDWSSHWCDNQTELDKWLTDNIECLSNPMQTDLDGLKLVIELALTRGFVKGFNAK
jgi:hypothetical protein